MAYHGGMSRDKDPFTDPVCLMMLEEDERTESRGSSRPPSGGDGGCLGCGCATVAGLVLLICAVQLMGILMGA